MFKNDAVSDALSDMGCSVSEDVRKKLKDFAEQNFDKMKNSSLTGMANLQMKLTQPIFFWPLKESLYVIGLELAKQAIDEYKTKIIYN